MIGGSVIALLFMGSTLLTPLYELYRSSYVLSFALAALAVCVALADLLFPAREIMFVGIELLEIRGNGAHGNEFGAFDAALRMFPRFANIDQHNFFPAIDA